MRQQVADKFKMFPINTNRIRNVSLNVDTAHLHLLHLTEQRIQLGPV